MAFNTAPSAPEELTDDQALERLHQIAVETVATQIRPTEDAWSNDAKRDAGAYAAEELMLAEVIVLRESRILIERGDSHTPDQAAHRLMKAAYFDTLTGQRRQRPAETSAAIFFAAMARSTRSPQLQLQIATAYQAGLSNLGDYESRGFVAREINAKSRALRDTDSTFHDGVIF